MSLRSWIRAVAVLLLMCGLVSLPNPGGSPKRWTSLFYGFADAGAFLYIALTLIAASVVLFVLSYIGSRRD
jgi:hypothetical protein